MWLCLISESATARNKLYVRQKSRNFLPSGYGLGYACLLCWAFTTRFALSNPIQIAFLFRALPVQKGRHIMPLRSSVLALLALLSLALLRPAQAQVTAAPALMNFQGRLAKPDGTPV